MKSIQADGAIGMMVAERPGRSRVFERFGIDYCCGGKKPLRDVCETKEISLQAIIRKLELDDARIDMLGTGQNWLNAPLPEVVTHIVDTHHHYLKCALPRLTFLIGKVAAAHGEKNPSLNELADVFAVFRKEMEAHAAKEEKVEFPYILDLAGNACSMDDSILGRIEDLEAEHESAGAALAKMRTLTNGFTAPKGSCNTYMAMLDALKELEFDTHIHVHLENSILFPRAIALQAN
ncbi:MAG: iron-sulfur cluster repair di-iron protein [Chthonomonadales bacterium]